MMAIRLFILIKQRLYGVHWIEGRVKVYIYEYKEGEHRKQVGFPQKSRESNRVAAMNKSDMGVSDE